MPLRRWRSIETIRSKSSNNLNATSLCIFKRDEKINVFSTVKTKNTAIPVTVLSVPQVLVPFSISVVMSHVFERKSSPSMSIQARNLLNLNFTK